ncbi:MAG: hypothetical protein ABFC77_09225 [Thermoguttaceae bacterium]
MKHFTLPCFWRRYRQLPKDIQELADKNYKRLAMDPQHPSLQLKKVGEAKQLWSVRVGMHYRALGLDKPEGVVWFWIGSHAEYDKALS